MFKCVFFFLRLFYIVKKLCRVAKTLPLIKLFSFNRMIFTKLEKPKNQNFENVWSEAHVCFFFGFPRVFLFFFFGHDLEKAKKTQGFFCFFWINGWLKNCEKPKKTQVFFGFLHGLLLHVF